MSRVAIWALAVLVLTTAAACVPAQPVETVAPPVEAVSRGKAEAAMPAAGLPDAATVTQPNLSRIYKLGPGDRLRVTVFGEEDLSGEFEVDGEGQIALPLIGEIDAGGLTVRSLETRVTETLSSGYLVNPRVSIEVMNFRPFFIMGEVNEPGSYPYVNGLTVINAAAIAGGYTYRADTDDIILIREVNGEKTETQVREQDAVLPGDIIRVEERLF